jgi:enolase-phosphatase E1
MIKAIVTDIEGTTSSISFVHEVLFPYAREHMADFIRCNAEDPRVVPYLNDVRLESGEDLDLEGIIRQLKLWIAEDRKITPLKALQGMIWEAGYQAGDFTGHIYPDARQQLEAWHQQGIKLYVYSSGSVQAQKLLFGHTDYGDLTPLFDGYFDTRIGAKVETQSYRHIAEQLQLNPEEILFLSDIERELDAAHNASMQTLWLVREADPSTAASHLQVRNFTAIHITEGNLSIN